MSEHPLVKHLDLVPNFPIEGILFRDISPLLKDHLAETIDCMSALFSDVEWENIDYLVGIESRGFLFASALAYKQGKGTVLARKAGKLPNVKASKSYGLEYGTDKLEMQAGKGNVVILDDLIATGGSMMAAAELCTEVGYNVVGLGCLIDLSALNNFEYQGLKVKSAMQFDD